MQTFLNLTLQQLKPTLNKAHSPLSNLGTYCSEAQHTALKDRAGDTNSSTREPDTLHIPHLSPKQLWYGYD